jgi:hypothetical protein
LSWEYETQYLILCAYLPKNPTHFPHPNAPIPKIFLSAVEYLLYIVAQKERNRNHGVPIPGQPSTLLMIQPRDDEKMRRGKGTGR